MKIYQKFKELNIDTKPLGFVPNESKKPYFCIPKGAKIIGWTGVNDIHFCFIHSFGEMVFALNPMNTPGDCVQPLANSFSDFLCLLSTCGNTTALEQVHSCDEVTFNTFLAKNPINKEQLTVINAIHDKLQLEPMKQLFAYLKQLHTEFDFSKDQNMQIEAENPMNFNIIPVLILNNKIISNSSGCSLIWNPHLSEQTNKEIVGV